VRNRHRERNVEFHKGGKGDKKKRLRQTVIKYECEESIENGKIK
jgi:hypothetical protein